MSVGNPLVTMLDTDGYRFTGSFRQAVTFTGLLSAATPGALELDDIGVGEGPTSVAEPATLALVALTALGVGGMALARRRSGAFRPR